MNVGAGLFAGNSEGRLGWRCIVFCLVSCIIACGSYFMFMVKIAHVELEISVPEKGNFAIYWASEGGGYSEQNVTSTILKPGKEKYSFFLTDISKVGRLRVDTHDFTGEVLLKRLTIHQEGFEEISLEDPADFSKLIPLQHIGEIKNDKDGFLVTSLGDDPNFELNVSAVSIGLDPQWVLCRMFIISILTLVVLYAFAPLVENFAFVPLLLFGIWLLILTMAGISKDNVHPDEYVHTKATSYYADHWLPPVVEDPAIRNTYSVYGFSRLNSCEIYYLFAGKVHKMLQFFELPTTMSYRLFNVGLWGFIFILTIRSVHARIAALPYLVSSQTWYAFSYCSSDAFALFVSFLLTCQLIDQKSVLHQYLKGTSGFLRLVALVFLPLALGVLFTLKMNYYSFIGVFYLVLGLKILCTDEYEWDKRAAIKRLVLITFLGLTVLGVRVGADYVINGFDKKEKIATLQEEYANYTHKPSTPVSERGSTLYMKDRGITFSEMNSKYHWDIKTFHSSFGVFGYLNIISPQHFYLIVKWFGAALLTYFLISIAIGGGRMGIGVTSVVTGASLFLILVSIHHSWVADFQAQGRYLFPILPMAGIVLGVNVKAFDKRVLLLLIGIMTLLGLYSFIFQGILKIPKIPF